MATDEVAVLKEMLERFGDQLRPEERYTLQYLILQLPVLQAMEAQRVDSAM
jgi:hypothetical protein